MTAKPSHTDHGAEYWGIERVEHLEEEIAHWQLSHRLVCAELAEREAEVARLTWELGLARERLREALHDLNSTGAELDVARYDLRKAREWNHQGDEG